MAEAHKAAFRRVRWVYALAAGAVIALGLWARSDAAGLPWTVAKYAGDSLWALVAFLGIAVLLPRRSTWAVAGRATIFVCAVELSQLYHAAWFDAVRSMRLGGLVLGTPASAFAWLDIAAYLIGIAFGGAIELAVGIRSVRLNARSA